jgi:hypothetical protein
MPTLERRSLMTRPIALAAALALSASTLAVGAATAQTTSGTTATQPSGSSGLRIPNLVNVNLRNVLNDVAVNLNIDRANVPINIQLPVQLAANVCGVSVNVLALSTGGQANCTAKTAPQSLTQAVQQQLAAGGSVGGGAQSSVAANTGTASSGTASGGASGVNATSSGANTGAHAPAPSTTATAPSATSSGANTSATAPAVAPAPAPAPTTSTRTQPAPRTTAPTATRTAPSAAASGTNTGATTAAVGCPPVAQNHGADVSGRVSNPHSASRTAPGHNKHRR